MLADVSIQYASKVHAAIDDCQMWHAFGKDSCSAGAGEKLSAEMLELIGHATKLELFHSHVHARVRIIG